MTLSLLERAQIALAETGWRSVTTFPEGFEPREFSLVYDGGLYYLFSTHPADSGTVVYSAATLEGLGDAAPTVVSASSLWYPNAVKMDKTWYVFGTTGAAQVGFVTAEDLSDPSSITTLRSGFFNIDLNDPAVMVTNIDGTNYWLLVGMTTTPGRDGRLIIRVYSHTDPPTAAGWTLLEEGQDDVLLNVGVPSWASVNSFNPNIYAVDGRYYVGFDGVDGENTRSGGIVQLDVQGSPPNSAYAAGQVLQLYSTPPEVFQYGDPTFVSCPDGVDRLFAAKGDSIFALDLPANNGHGRGAVALSDASRGSVSLSDAAVGAVAVSDAAVGSVAISDRSV